MLTYPIDLKEDTNGSLLVTFPDIPEAATCARSKTKAFAEALRAFESALEFYSEDGRLVPMPSAPKRGQQTVTLPADVSEKVLLLNKLIAQNARQLSIEQHLQALEESLLQPDLRKSARLSELLAERFIEFGSSGRIYTKAQIVAALQAESPVQVTAMDFKVQLLAPHIALVTYRAHRHGEPGIHTLRSSVWEQTLGQWQMVFHQGTITTV